MSTNGKVILIKRCPRCFISPLPQDLHFFWGASPEDLKKELCLRCRIKPSLHTTKEETKPVVVPLHPKPQAVVFYAPKLDGLQSKEIKDCYLTPEMRNAIRQVQYHSPNIAYVTDGERLWRWVNFPHNTASYYTWDQFITSVDDWNLWEKPPQTRGGGKKTASQATANSAVVVPFEYIKN